MTFWFHRFTSFFLLSGWSFLPFTHAAESPARDALAPYAPAQTVQGSLHSIGSDTLNNLMTFWAEGFARFHPGVKVQVEGKGSSTAPAALLAGAAQLGPMSRRMSTDEVDAFERKYGYPPQWFVVALDALALFVHKDNPLPSLSLEQIDALYSVTRQRSGAPAVSWGDLGLTGPWARRPISLYGRNSASGTHGFFKDLVLQKGDFKPDVKEQTGSAAVVLGVQSDPNGIGYSAIGYRSSGVRPVPISQKNLAPVAPTQSHCADGSYPISRRLYLYVNIHPAKGPDPAVREFIRFVYSREGQQIVIKDGYFPLSPEQAAENLLKLSTTLQPAPRP